MSGSPIYKIHRQTFDGAILENDSMFQTPKKSPKASICPNAPLRNNTHLQVDIDFTTESKVLIFESESECPSPPRPIRKRVATATYAPIKDEPTQSRLSEAPEQRIEPNRLF
jgi:hypothetical protein